MFLALLLTISLYHNQIFFINLRVQGQRAPFQVTDGFQGWDYLGDYPLPVNIMVYIFHSFFILQEYVLMLVIINVTKTRFSISKLIKGVCKFYHRHSITDY